MAVPSSSEDADAELHSRISAAVSQIGSLKLAADLIGVSEDSVGRWSVGPTKPPFHKVVALCRAANFHVEWMATGEGPRDIGAVVTLPISRKRNEQRVGAVRIHDDQDESDQALVMLPQLAVEASAGPGLIASSESVERYVGIKEEYLREIGVNPRHAHVLRVSGRSMAPTISDRDIVVVDTSVRTPVNEGLYTVVYGDTVLIKRVRLQRDGGVMLISDNKTEGYADELVPRSELDTLAIVGRVKGHIRSL